MYKNKKINIPVRLFFLLCVAAMFSACDSMARYIEIESADLPPMLAVSSYINTDGSFRVAFTEARSIGSYRNWRREEETIIRRGDITLLDETGGDTVLSIRNEEFDMSLRSYQSGYFITRIGLRFVAGHTYRLTLDIEGYPVATATAVMPDAPLVEHVSLDTRQMLHFNNVYQIISLEPNTFSVYSMDCYPITLRLSDNSPQRDYYMLYLQMTNSNYGDEPYNLPVSISDRAVIQDNPDIEAAQLFLDGEIGAFTFDRMLLSDMSFANTTGTVNLLVNAAYEISGGLLPEPKCDERSLVTVYVCVARLDAGPYAYYRSLALQGAGMGFFSEPVSIASNIKNGYGCFAAINTVREKIMEYEICAFD